MFAFRFLPISQGRRVAIVSGPGGLAVGAADECMELGLELAPLAHDTTERIDRIIPSVGTSTSNPIDLSIVSLLSPRLYEEVIRVLDGDGSVDMLLIIGIGGKEFNEMMSGLIREVKKPLALVLPVTPDIIADEYLFLFKSGIAVYPDSKRAARALRKLVEYAEFLRDEG
jgi:acyl-CoA synthetase (NDP forming)